METNGVDDAEVFNVLVSGAWIVINNVLLIRCGLTEVVVHGYGSF